MLQAFVVSVTGLNGLVLAMLSLMADGRRWALDGGLVIDGCGIYIEL